MSSIAMTVFLDSVPGELVELPHAGTGLEHPLVFDSAAREIHDLAAEGRVEVVQETVRQRGQDTLIEDITFKRIA